MCVSLLRIILIHRPAPLAPRIMAARPDATPATLPPRSLPGRVVAALRRALFWTHLVLGVSAGLVILLMSVTGVMLGYEKQLIRAIDGAPTVAVPPDAQRLPLDTLLARHALDPAGVASVALRADPAEPVLVRFRDRELGSVRLDPYTADTVAAVADGKAAAFMSATRRWHRWIGAQGGELRDQLRAVTGAANLAFLLIVLSGLWLWWPRTLTWSAVRNVIWFRRGLRPKARDFNWHNTLGFWSAIPLALIVASGVFISYQWPERWLDAALGETALSAQNGNADDTAGESRRSRTLAQRRSARPHRHHHAPRLAAGHDLPPRGQRTRRPRGRGRGEHLSPRPAPHAHARPRAAARCSRRRATPRSAPAGRSARGCASGTPARCSASGGRRWPRS